MTGSTLPHSFPAQVEYRSIDNEIEDVLSPNLHIMGNTPESHPKAFCELKILAHDFFPIMPMILALYKNDIVLHRPVDVSVKIQCNTLVKYLVQYKVMGSEILGKNATSKFKNVLLLCPKSRK